MSTENQDDDQTIVFAVTGGIIALVIASVLGLSIWTASSGTPATSAVAPAPAASAAAPVVAAAATAAAINPNAASVVVENGVVKFYFASGKSDLAAGGKDALAQVVQGVQGGQRAVVSGFHDSTGSLAANQELAKKRAIAVRDALVGMGVAADKIEFKKPENASGGAGNNPEARRVEVVLAK